jgi:protein-tyrosine kinase
MDRLRKALDIARRERVRAADPDSDATPHSGPRTILPRPTAIRYTQTMSFMPPPGLLEANRVVDIGRSSPEAAAFRVLRTQVLQRMEEHRWQSLAIFSPTSEDGKTTTAVNLAISLANDERHTVLLVDFDLRRPTIASKFGLEPYKGTDDVLRGGARISHCLYHPELFDRLVVFPARAPMEHSSEAISGPRGRNLVAELRSRYPDRIVLFDLPPVLGADDALAFAPLIECGLVVVSEGSTRREDLLRSMELLRKTPIVGTVLNRGSYVPSAYG